MMSITLVDNVRCGKLPHFRDPTIVDKTHPTIPGFININATSANRQIWKDLSPMKIGPFVMTQKLIPTTFYPNGVHPGFIQVGNETGIRVEVLENIWQGSKVYDIDIINGVIQPSFFLRRAKMAADKDPHRRALPKAAGNIITSFWNGEILDYVSSRRYYCFYYAYLVQNTEAFQQLKQLLNAGNKLHIIGYDGYDIGPITKDSVNRAIRDPSRPFGHELVLCCLLKGLMPWLEL